MMKFKKVIRREIKNPADQSSNFGAELNPVLKKIFLARNIAHDTQLNYRLDNLLPYKHLTHITEAAELLYQALQQQEKILIIGDFDADGATSTALSVRVLKAFGAKYVDYLVPNRFDFGYGLTPEIVEVAKTLNPDLIMTVDNGIVNYAGVDAVRAAGIKIIITDHHLAGETLPNAHAIVNPNQPNDDFPSKNLAGVGVAFYLMLALRAKLIAEHWFTQQQLVVPNMADFLDIVALGTVADVVPLDHNNRILVYQGLKRIRVGKTIPGIRALLEIAKRNVANIQAQDLGFAIGPRLNAAGRMDDMSHGIECLLTDDSTLAWQYAQELDSFNQERKSVEQSMQTQALTALKQIAQTELSNHLPLGICLFNADWHQGVIGILASRIKDRTHRPVIIFAQDKAGVIKGSARSITGIHMRDSLAEVDALSPGLLIKYGGHAMAAGLSIAEQDLAKFTELFNQVLTRKNMPDLFEPIIHTDGELAASELTLRFAEILYDWGPWGQNFPEPCFDGLFKIIDQRVLAGKHLKLTVEPVSAPNTYLDAIAFNIDIDQWPGDSCRKVALVYQVNINEYNHRRKLQLLIQQIEPIHIMELGMKLPDIYQALEQANSHYITTTNSKTANTALDKIAIHELTIDSRTVTTNDVFIAIKGENFDGHDYLAQAKQHGAIAALVTKTNPDIQGLIQIEVPDTVIAFGQLAHYWRRKFSIPMIAITGSQGKTTVREMVASILKLAVGESQVLVSQKNYNNHLGLPITLSQLNAQHQYAVLELGMNHEGEIAYLTRLCEPTVGAITLAALTHGEGFTDGVTGIARAKGELFAELGPSATAVINRDDDYFTYWHKLLKNPDNFVSFSAANNLAANYYLEEQAGQQYFVTPKGKISIQLNLPGEHNKKNALCAMALALTAKPDLELATIKQALETIKPVPGRCEFLTTQQEAIIINDSYNSSPSSVTAAIKVLAEQPGQKILVLSDMAEIGPTEEQAHRDLAAVIAEHHIDQFIAIGQLIKYAYDEYCERYPDQLTHYFRDKAAAKTYLQQLNQPNTVFLIKGSRGMQMEQVVDYLL